MDLIIATTNHGKLAEIRKIVPDSFIVKGLHEIGCTADIPETGLTFEENALQKARFVSTLYQKACIADDSGLEVEALGGRPGVYSARYSGPGATDAENFLKLLRDLEGVTNRKARFVCCISLIINSKEYVFGGELIGSIATEPSGHSGFGYDPVFIPEGADKTLAHYSPDEKNAISHRGKALKKMIDFIRSEGIASRVG